MKTFILTASIIVVGFILLGQSQCSEKSKPSVTKSTQTENSTQPPQPSEPNPGWKSIGMENGYTMYQPSTDTTTTEWFCIEDWNSTYALRDCIMQFKKKSSGEIVSFRYDSTKIECYLETFPGSGIFAEKKWAGYDETGMTSTHVRFVKTTEPFNVTVGVKKLAP